MTPEEKIEALREWVRSNDEPDFGQFAAGYLKALTEVRDIIDPPKPRCGMSEGPHEKAYDIIAAVNVTVARYPGDLILAMDRNGWEDGRCRRCRKAG